MLMVHIIYAHVYTYVHTYVYIFIFPCELENRADINDLLVAGLSLFPIVPGV